MADQAVDPSAGTNVVAEHMTLNIPYLLHLHLNHASNESIITDLYEIESKFSADDRSIFRLLKLLCCSTFNVDLFNDKSRIGMGRFGKVYECSVPNAGKVALKLFDLPHSIHDDCVIFDVYTEIACLERMSLHKDSLTLYDFGVSRDAYWMVMEHYPFSLTSWRKSVGISNFSRNNSDLKLTFEILLRIIDFMSLMHSSNIVHFDIKGDNILLCPPSSESSHFRVAVADYGQSLIYTVDDTGTSLIGRGTENIQSPEMLALTKHLNRSSSYYDVYS